MKTISTIQSKQFRDILTDVKGELLKLFGDSLNRLILYGSYARNEQEPGSDIDIIALVDEDDITLRKYTYKIADIMTGLSLKYDTLVSITEQTYERYNEYLDVLPFYRNIYNEGIEIYGKDTA
jgi:uncharacterized protein